MLQPTTKLILFLNWALTIDMALGIGGVPRGRIIEIYGPESSGKTTLVSHIIANAQKLGGSLHLLIPSTH